MGTIHATSDDDPDSGQQASVRIEGSDTWVPALVPMHAPRGSRTPSAGAVPVVGCLVHDARFVLSWADMRCRPVSTNASFPAECDGGTQRNVAVEDTAAAISFVESLKQGGRRKLDLEDTENTFVKGKKTAIMVIISPSDATTAAAAWDYIPSDHGSPNTYVDAVVRRLAPHVSCAQPTRPSPYMSAGELVTPSPPPQMEEVNSTLYGWSWGELEFEWTTVGPFKVGALISYSPSSVAVTRTLLPTRVLCVLVLCELSPYPVSPEPNLSPKPGPTQP